jgi:hypothetical protein
LGTNILYHIPKKGAQIMANDLKIEDDFFKKHIQAHKARKSDVLKFETLINLACNGHYPLFFPQWITESINTVRRPITSREAKSNVERMMKITERHNTLSKKRTALLSLNDKERNLCIRSFIKLVELSILDKYDLGLH